MNPNALIGEDVSLLDPRSVKGQLAGHGDDRAAWWNFCCAVMTTCCKDKSLEMAMYRFHKFHGELFLLPLEIAAEFKLLCKAVKKRGIFKVLREYLFPVLNH